MAARNLAPVRTLVREAIPLIGSFAPNGSSAVAATSRKGLGYTVARTAAGLFTVTLTDKFADIVTCTAQVQAPAAVDLKAQIRTITASSASVAASVQIALLAVATDTDQAANANARVHFVIWVRNSAALPTAGS